MHRFLKKSIALAWLACLALLFGGFAPAVTHALDAQPSSTAEAEVCTASGIKLVHLAGGDLPAHPGGGGHLQHCGYCLAHDLALGGAPAMFLPIVAARRGASLPLPSVAPRALFPFTVAAQRAPPAAA